MENTSNFNTSETAFRGAGELNILDKIIIYYQQQIQIKTNL